MFTEKDLIKSDKEYRSKERAKNQLISIMLTVLLVCITIFLCAIYGVFTTLLFVLPGLAISILIMSGVSGNWPHRQLRILIQELKQDIASVLVMIKNKFR